MSHIQYIRNVGDAKEDAAFHREYDGRFQTFISIG